MSSLPRVRGVVLYRGPSQLDGEPIVAIATFNSANSKTGAMVQTWILREDVHPSEAIQNGTDESICGDCPLRGLIADGRNSGRACYVRVHQAPRAVWDGFQRGIYPTYDPSQHAQPFRGRMLRLGSYGDPAAVPYRLWRDLCKLADGRTGYTHQWRQRRFWRFRRLVMASCESLDDARLAQSRGWRTFRTMPVDTERAENEIHCPASKEQGMRLTCEQCGACNGSDRTPGRHSVAIWAHGGPAIMSNYRKLELM